MPSKKTTVGRGADRRPNANAKLQAGAKEFVPSATNLKVTSNAWQPNDGATPVTNGSSDSRSPAAEALKQAPKVPPAPSAWGGKSSASAAIKKAGGSARPQQQQRSGGGARGQAQQVRGGGAKRGSAGGIGRRNEQSGGGGGGGGGSWSRAASKPGGQKDGINRRQRSGGEQGDRADDSKNSNWSRGKVLPVELMKPGEGKTDAERAVKRVGVEDLLAMRLSFVAPPSSWEGGDSNKPPAACLWDSPTRIAEIKEASKAPRIGGDVSQKKKGGGGGGKGGRPNLNDTAPPLEDCKPLEVNEETRWKAKVMENKENQAEQTESKEEILRKATLILNKLSLTKFDKLSDEFINCGIGRDVDCLTGAVGLIVTYAQEQQHFSSMYAGLCLKLANTPLNGIDEGSKKGKKFKKILLERCQMEFETDTSTKIKEATMGATEVEEIEYHANIIKKHYLGHMRFIGELYKGDLISIKIMLHCLPALLKGEDDQPKEEVDEEKVECFSKLMTVIGSSLEQQTEAMRSVGKADASKNLANCWRTVEIMAGRRREDGPRVSNRIKFMLQDLLEMKEKGWVTRRKEETAKTIAQIHKEVANEERAAARRSSSNASLRGMSKGSLRRGASSGDVRVLDNQQRQQREKPRVDEDGFVSVPTNQKGGFSRSVSMTAMHRSNSREGFQKYNPRGSTILESGGGSSRRPSLGKFAVLSESSDSRRNSKKENTVESDEKVVAKEEKPAKEKKSKVTYPTAEECGEKAKNVLKEYFVGGDLDDAVLSIHELVGVGDEGSVDRGNKVVESGVLLVLEMKAEHIEKFLTVYLRCAKEKKIDRESFVIGLNDPLEFLSDVAIDAPLALPHMVNIVAEIVKADIIPFGFLLNTPDYFRTDQNAADFGAKVMKQIGGDAVTSEDHIEVIDKLMTCDDKARHSSAADLVKAA